MRCVKCNYITFDYYQECPKCKTPVPGELKQLYPLQFKPVPPDYTQEYMEVLGGVSLLKKQEPFEGEEFGQGLTLDKREGAEFMEEVGGVQLESIVPKEPEGIQIPAKEPAIEVKDILEEIKTEEARPPEGEIELKLEDSLPRPEEGPPIGIPIMDLAQEEIRVEPQVEPELTLELEEVPSEEEGAQEKELESKEEEEIPIGIKLGDYKE